MDTIRHLAGKTKDGKRRERWLDIHPPEAGVASTADRRPSSSTDLRRRLSLPLLSLYGMGVTIGAGIYVLVGKVAIGTGVHAPLSFLVAAVLTAFTAFSCAELSGRVPKSAGEAMFVQTAFGDRDRVRRLSSRGRGRAIDARERQRDSAARRDRRLGIGESVVFAAILTVAETAELLLIIGAGTMKGPDIVQALPKIVTPAGWGEGAAILLGTVSTFVGFEDIINVAEEAKDPVRTVSRATIIPPIMGETSLIGIRQLHVAKEHLTGPRGIETGENVQKRRLAAAGRAEQKPPAPTVKSARSTPRSATTSTSPA